VVVMQRPNRVTGRVDRQNEIQFRRQNLPRVRVATIIEGRGVRIIEGWGEAASVEVEEAGRRRRSQRTTHVSRNRGRRSNRGKVGANV